MLTEFLAAVFAIAGNVLTPFSLNFLNATIARLLGYEANEFVSFLIKDHLFVEKNFAILIIKIRSFSYFAIITDDFSTTGVDMTVARVNFPIIFFNFSS